MVVPTVLATAALVRCERVLVRSWSGGVASRPRAAEKLESLLMGILLERFPPCEASHMLRRRRHPREPKVASRENRRSARDGRGDGVREGRERHGGGGALRAPAGPLPGAGDPAVDDDRRAEHAVAAGDDAVGELAVEDRPPVAVAEDELVEAGQQEQPTCLRPVPGEQLRRLG